MAFVMRLYSNYCLKNLQNQCNFLFICQYNLKWKGMNPEKEKEEESLDEKLDKLIRAQKEEASALKKIIESIKSSIDNQSNQPN